MICKKCGLSVEEGTLICPECGEEIALQAQADKINAIILNKKKVLSDSFSSKLFLVLTICLSIISFFNFTNALIELINSANIIGAALDVLFGVFALLGCIMGFKLFASKAACNKDSLSKFNLYNKSQSILYLVVFIIVAVLIGIMFLFVLIGDLSYVTLTIEASGFANADEIAEMLESARGILAVAILFMGAIVLTILFFFYHAFKKMKIYIEDLADTSESCVYRIRKKHPYVLLWVLGILGILGGLVTLAGNPSISNVIQLISVSGSAGYLIISAMLFKVIHEKEQKLEAEYATAKAVYEHIAKQTEVAKNELGPTPFDELN